VRHFSNSYYTSVLFWIIFTSQGSSDRWILVGRLKIPRAYYVINTRIEHAKTLLLTTGMSVSEIAEEVGYSSSGSLINLFTKRVGKSPGQYRKSHKGLARK